eukprot:608778_1
MVNNMSTKVIFSLLLSSIYICNATTSIELDAIKDYELIHFENPKSFESTNHMEFDVFGEHYVVDLEAMDHLNPSDIRHNINPSDHASPEHGTYFTSLSKTCHYYGTVLNTNQASHAILSLCPKRGIRGYITAFNETIHIQPASVYLDVEKDYHGVHQLSDPHLVYKESDRAQSPLHNIHSPSHHDGNDMTEMHMDVDATSTDSNSPRRLASFNDGNNEIEIIILSGPARTRYYRGKWDNWYEQLVGDTADLLAMANGAYKAANWPSKIGKMRLKFAEFEAPTTFTGKYSSLKPAFRTSANNGKCFDDVCCTGNDLNQYYNGRCSVSESNYLDKWTKWLQNNKKGTYDNGMLIDNMPFFFNVARKGSVSGLAYLRSMCKSTSGSVNHDQWRWNQMVTAKFNANQKSVAGTLAHETGHCLGMSHTAECNAGGYWVYGKKNDCNKCTDEKNVMGNTYDKIENGFDSCAMDETLWYFECSDWDQCYGNDNGLQCLGKKNNYVGVDDSGSSDPPSGGGGGGGECVRVSRASNSAVNDDYKEKGTAEGAKAYESSNGWWLYRILYQGSTYSWVISKTKGHVSWGNGWCDGGANVLSGCNTQWSNNANIKLAACTNAGNAGGGGNTGGSSGGDCSGYECININSMAGYSGRWSGNKCDDEGRYYYQRNGKILCFNTGRSKWIITDSLCDFNSRSAHCTYRSNDDLLKCQDNWKVKSGSSFKSDDSVQVSSCSAGFRFDDASDCLLSKGYDESVCIYNGNNTIAPVLWNGTRQFVYYDGCLAEQPVYHYHDMNESYYLHYVYNEDAAMGQWVISSDMLSDEGDAMCLEDDLNECTDGKWIAWELHGGDSERQTVHGSMFVGCTLNTDAKGEVKVAFVVLIVVSVSLVAIVIAVCVVFISKRRSVNSKGQYVEDDSDQENEEMEEIEVDVDGDSLVKETTSASN